MTIQSISKTTNNVVSNINKKITTPKNLLSNTPVNKTNEKNTQSSTAFMNYFLGSQSIPSFKGFSAKTTEFNKSMPDVSCACCGKEMVPGTKIAEKLAAEFNRITGDERIKFLDENMKIFRPVEKTIARALKELAEENPDKKTVALVAILAKDPEAALKKGQSTILNEVDAEAIKHYGKDNQISEFIKTQKPLITGERDNKKFLREDFVAKVNELTTSLGNEEAKGQILNKAIDIPFENAYFKRMTKDAPNPHKFTRRMFINAIKTAEHIRPHSLGGRNHTSNYMSECNECNENRQNYDLNTYWQTNYPSMPYNVQNYADSVTEKIINGEIGPKFVDYPKDLKVAVESETKDQIKLKVLNPEEINKKREEKGLEPLAIPQKREENNNTKPDEVKK